jgi:hypothetical protein
MAAAHEYDVYYLTLTAKILFAAAGVFADAEFAVVTFGDCQRRTCFWYTSVDRIKISTKTLEGFQDDNNVVLAVGYVTMAKWNWHKRFSYVKFFLLSLINGLWEHFVISQLLPNNFKPISLCKGIHTFVPGIRLYPCKWLCHNSCWDSLFPTASSPFHTPRRRHERDRKGKLRKTSGSLRNTIRCRWMPRLGRR